MAGDRAARRTARALGAQARLGAGVVAADIVANRRFRGAVAAAGAALDAGLQVRVAKAIGAAVSVALAGVSVTAEAAARGDKERRSGANTEKQCSSVQLHLLNPFVECDLGAYPAKKFPREHTRLVNGLSAVNELQK
jgi:hypothetical protein